MENKNLTYKWWKNTMADKIVIEKEILDWENPIRGIYGIFTRENEAVYCAYVGRANNIYNRFFSSKGIQVIWSKSRITIIRMKK